MGLQTGFAPDASDARWADVGRLRHRRAAPVGRIRRRLACRLSQHRQPDLVRQRRDPRGPRLVEQQAVDTFLDVALLPPPHGGLRLAGAPHDLVGAITVGRCQNDPSAPDGLARTVAALDNGIERQTVRRAHVKANVISSHEVRLTDLPRTGNQLLGGAH